MTTVKKHSMPKLDARSLLLLTGLLLGACLGARAQPPASPDTQAAQLTATSTKDGIPHNQTSAKDLDAAFNRADQNRDGRLSRQETEHFPAVVQRFDQIDANHDNFISREELNRAAGSSY
ncbi:EF-hand domain-containing protein [Polaromonas sp. OV174]|uniref:EF-hand domain-containing protein n=1 Tax=Polaromonas sp. OV174 TaxID=1855300 RepID=UPI000B82E6A6|nr:EF-hand domain-containing protein [Polaromonas sp. OV174]